MIFSLGFCPLRVVCGGVTVIIVAGLFREVERSWAIFLSTCSLCLESVTKSEGEEVGYQSEVASWPLGLLEVGSSEFSSEGCFIRKTLLGGAVLVALGTAEGLFA